MHCLKFENYRDNFVAAFLSEKEKPGSAADYLEDFVVEMNELF
jgi:hypothetical protein